MRHKGFSLIELFIVIVLLGICAALTIPAWYNYKERQVEIKTYIEAHTGTQYNVVSGWSEKTGNAFALALENPETKSWEHFLPCSQEQMRLQITDKVKFVALEEPLEFANYYITEEYRKLAKKNCYLKIVAD
jgi:prepilin-type N-terminal cleavage/methylation domain-containing protein